MTAPMLIDEPDTLRKRFRIPIRIGIGLMGIFAILSLVDAINGQGLHFWYSTIVDWMMFIVLIVIYVLISHYPIDLLASVLSICVIIYSLLSVTLFPNQVLRDLILPLVVLTTSVPYIDSSRLHILSVLAWIATGLMFWLSDYSTLLSTPIIDSIAFMGTHGLILFTINQFHNRMNEALTQTRLMNSALIDARNELEQQVAERTASLQDALEELRIRAEAQSVLIVETEQQRATIRALGVPVLPISQGILVIPLVGTFETERIQELRDRSLHAVQEMGAHHLVLDMTGVTIVDRDLAHGVLEVAQAVRLLGAHTVLVGVRPEMAEALVSLGVNFETLHTAATLQEGLKQAMHSEALAF